MRFLSLFSGIEAASVAWLPLGWECAAVAEIDKFPCAVLKHHYPDVPNLGDITKITEDRIKSLGCIDVIVFGSPCQDVSVAGKRAGLTNSAGERTRSGLFFNAMKIVEWTNAEWVVFENVPGLISSHGGDDFNLVLDSFESLGYHVEVDICDAQFFGVPQRRRRIFCICHKLDAGLKKKMLLSAVITLKLLFSIWQQNWDEATRQLKAESRISTSDEQKPGQRSKKTTSEPTSKINQMTKSLSISIEVSAPSRANASDSASITKDCVDGLRKRINLFETLLSGLSAPNMEPASLETLLSVLDETFRSSLSGPKNSDADSARPINENHSGADTDESETPLAYWCLSTLPSWKDVLAASYNLLNESITSTASNQTTEMRTYSFAQALLSITASTANLLKLLPNSWREELSLSTMTQEVMKFAKERVKNGSSNSQVPSQPAGEICDWLLVLWQAEYQDLAIRNLGNRNCSPTLLSFSESLSRDTPPSREKRESAPTIPSRRTAGGGLGTDFDCDGGLVAESAQVAFGGNNTGGPISVATAVNAHGGPKGRLDFESETFVTGVTHSLRGDGFDASEDGTGRGTPLVPVVYRTNAAGQVDNQGPLSAALTSQTDPCTQFIAFNLRGREGGSLPEPAPDNQASMRAASGGSSRSYVAQAIGLDEEQNATVDGMGCLKARREGGGFEGTVMTPAMQVRRLTPVECRRLQDFPDDYLDIIYNGKPAADGPKYKALGNSFAVPVVRWIGQRIQLIDLFS